MKPQDIRLDCGCEWTHAPSGRMYQTRQCDAHRPHWDQRHPVAGAILGALALAVGVGAVVAGHLGGVL